MDRKTLWSFMFLLTGTVGVSVDYLDPGCAVKGSTVTLLCTFSPVPSFMEGGREVLTEIIRVVWCRNHEICQGSTPSVYDSEVTNHSPRYRYLGDKKGNCSLQITDVQKEDEGTLRFRMEAKNVAAHFTGKQGVMVTVTDGTPMTIMSSSNSEKFEKGESVALSCTTRCTFHQLEITWFRDGHTLLESGPTLHLTALTAEDSGNYTCGVKDNIGTLSQPHSLYVEAEDEGGAGGADQLPLIVGVMVGVLLVIFTLILAVCIIKRKKRVAAAGTGHPAVGGEVEQKPPDGIYSDILLSAEQQDQQPSWAVEDVSYASVQFKHKNQASMNQNRPAGEVEDAIIYSSVVSRG